MINETRCCGEEARLLRLKRHYKKLLAHYHNQQHEVQLNDIANILSCTPRYARTLLKEMQTSGWIIWSSLPGRGKLSLIQCRHDKESLEHAQTSPEHSPVTYNASHTTRAVEGDNFVFRYYHPLPAIIPKPSALYLSRHLIRMVHIGLTKYKNGNSHPELALAHHVEISADRLQWRFYIRRGLVWHNGEPFEIADCLPRLLAFKGTALLPYVCDIQSDEQCIVFHLLQPDELLINRLANSALAISHPVHPTVGLGPFKVINHTDELITLQRFPHWFGESPLAGMITIDTRLRKPNDWGMTSLSTEKRCSSSESLKTLMSRDTFSFLTFNRTKRNAISDEQCGTLATIAKSVASAVIKKYSDIFATEEWLTISLNTLDIADLPATLTMSYFSTPDTENFVQLFSNYLSRRGCRLEATPIHYSHWPVTEQHWMNMDIALGYLSSMQSAAFTFEERWRRSNMVKVFWPSTMQTKILELLKHSAMRDPARHLAFLIYLQRHAIRHKLMVPLYSKQFTLKYPHSVKGVHPYPQCWPDFTLLWIDASLEGNRC